MSYDMYYICCSLETISAYDIGQNGMEEIISILHLVLLLCSRPFSLDLIMLLATVGLLNSTATTHP